MSPQRIKHLRGRMSLVAFAALLGVTQPAVWYWEAGKHPPRGPAMILLRMMQKDRAGMIRVLSKMALMK